MKKLEFNIEGMSCGHCVKAVKNELSKLELEVKSVEIGNAKINYDDSKVNESQIIAAIEEAGFKIRK